MEANADRGSIRRWMYMLSLMLAGEAIYTLPYLRRGFQTSMQEVFDVTFTQLGWMNAMFGILAISVYAWGGWLSDRVSARKLLSFSLIATGLGGFYMATVPSFPMLVAIHAFWGVTTILTFWAALIKAARLWGSPNQQGFTFGLLDSGRGVVAAVLASIAVWVYALYPGDVRGGLMAVIFYYSSASVLVGVFVFLFVAEDTPDSTPTTSTEPGGSSRLLTVLKMPVIWLQGLIILFAYWLYIGTFEFSAFAEKAFDQDKVFGAQVNAVREWMRPVAALAAGLIADRIRITRAISVGFVLAGAGYLSMALLPAEAGMLAVLWVQVLVTSIAVFALRGIYFALLEESKVPLVLTGTAIGVISTIGYTPDFFAYVLVGWLVDTYGAVSGYSSYFTILAGAAVCGVVITATLGRFDRNTSGEQQ